MQSLRDFVKVAFFRPETKPLNLESDSSEVKLYLYWE